MRTGFVAAVAALGMTLSAGAAAADEAARTTVAKALETGRLADGVIELEALAAKGDPDALFGVGIIQFAQSVEHLSQGLYKYGLQPPHSVMMPIVRLPVPINPTPEPIDYQKFRSILLTFVSDLDAAQKTLAKIGAREVKMPIDLVTIRYDADGDGTIGPDERFSTVLARIMEVPPEEFTSGPVVVAFDNGDAFWLQGYCHVLEAFGEFLLAYDWHESFDDSFHIFFPRAHSAFQEELAPPGDGLFSSEGAIADLISFLHIRWPVAEPARLLAVHEHLKSVTELSRASWRVIEAETDDDHEWIPNPNQTSVTGTPVTAGQIAAWAAVLDRVDALLDGKVLMPHWRFNKGINLKRVFAEPQPFDLVLWITGPAALPYLEDGPALTSQEWNDLTRAFGGSFGSYAIWFN